MPARSHSNREPDESGTAGGGGESSASAADAPAFKVTDKRAAARAADAPPEPRETDDELAEVRAELEQAHTRHAEILDRLTRTQADFANYRRRTELESQELAQYATQAVLLDALRVLDGLDRAFAALPAELRRLSWIDGIVIVHAQLRAVLEAQGVTRIECKPGDSLDISIHEVVMSEDGDGPVVVLEELQSGYRMHERVLRPALVRAGTRAEAEEVGSDAAEEDEETTPGDAADA